MKAKKNPLGEVFGYPTNNLSEETKHQRDNELCRFKGYGQPCTKVNAGIKIGVCSVLSKGSCVITCPYRFVESGVIFEEACKFAFGTDLNCRVIPEVSIHDATGKVAGNVDFVAVKLDSNKEILNFASVEIQGVYITGNVSNPFRDYLASPSADFEWTQRGYPKPDYRSSQKRLIAQIRLKGEIFRSWNKKQIVVIQKSFYESLPKVDRVSGEFADVLWVIVDLMYNDSKKIYELVVVDRVYTYFNDVLHVMGRSPAGSITKFLATLTDKLPSFL